MTHSRTKHPDPTDVCEMKVGLFSWTLKGLVVSFHYGFLFIYEYVIMRVERMLIGSKYG